VNDLGVKLNTKTRAPGRGIFFGFHSDGGLPLQNSIALVG
jgi:hypothetical protein